MEIKNIAIGVLATSTLALGGFTLTQDEAITPVVSTVVNEKGEKEIIKEISYVEKVVPSKVIQFKPYDVSIRFRPTDSSLQINLLAEDGTNGTIKIDHAGLSRPSKSDPTKSVRQLVDEFTAELMKEPNE